MVVLDARDGDPKFMALGYSISFAIIINLWAFRERPALVCIRYQSESEIKLLQPNCQIMKKILLPLSHLRPSRLLYLTADRNPQYILFHLTYFRITNKRFLKVHIWLRGNSCCASELTISLEAKNKRNVFIAFTKTEDWNERDSFHHL